MKTQEENQNQDRAKIIKKEEAEQDEVYECCILRAKIEEVIQLYCIEKEKIKIQVILNSLIYVLTSTIKRYVVDSAYEEVSDVINKMIKDSLMGRKIDVS